MKKFAGIFFSSLVLTAFAFSQPKIRVMEGTSFDFGEIYKGEKIERKVSVKNVGNKMLVITSVRAACGCTATLLTDREVPPGKNTSLSISFDSKSFTGQIHKNVFVNSNDPTDSTIEIRFTAKVIQVLEATPPYFYFSPGKQDSTMTVSTVLKNQSDNPIDILGVTTDDPQVRFDLRSTKLAPGQSTQLFVSYTPKQKGTVYKDVIIKTSHPKQSELAMKLVCNVRR